MKIRRPTFARALSLFLSLSPSPHPAPPASLRASLPRGPAAIVSHLPSFPHASPPLPRHAELANRLHPTAPLLRVVRTRTSVSNRPRPHVLPSPRAGLPQPSRNRRHDLHLALAASDLPGPYKREHRVRIIVLNPTPPLSSPLSRCARRIWRFSPPATGGFKRRLRRRRSRRVIAAATIVFTASPRSRCAPRLRRRIAGAPIRRQPSLAARFFLAAGRLRRRLVVWVSALRSPRLPLPSRTLSGRSRAARRRRPSVPASAPSSPTWHGHAHATVAPPHATWPPRRQFGLCGATSERHPAPKARGLSPCGPCP